MTRRRAAVLGSPVGHSLSPRLHRRAYEVLGLQGWTYGAYDVEPAGLATFLTRLDSTWAGLSLTMPLKAAVLPLLDSATDLVRAVGAANTVVFGDPESTDRPGHRWHQTGHNTDVPGLVAALAGAGIDRVAHAAVLGAGATARSAVAALGRLGAEVTVFARSPRRAVDLHRTASSLGVTLSVRPWAEAAGAWTMPLVVNTTPAGVADPLADDLTRGVTELGTLFEVLYHPWPTRLARAWGDRGGQIVDGLELLVRQAVLQVALMTGHSLEESEHASLVVELRAAGERALLDRSARQDGQALPGR